MHFDPYESKKNRNKRILSDVLIVLVVIGFLWGLYHVIFARTKINPFTFGDVTAVEDTDGGNESLAAFMEYAYDLYDEATLTDALREKYPLPAALLDMERPYDMDTPYFRYDGKRLVLAQTVLSETVDERILEIMAADVAVSESGEQRLLTLSNFRACGVACNAKTGALAYRPFDAETFHVKLMKLTLSATGASDLADVTLRIRGGSVPIGAEQLVYDENAAAYLPVKSNQDRRIVLDGAENCEKGLTLQVGNGAFVQFASVAFRFEPGEEEPRFAFTANKN